MWHCCAICAIFKPNNCTNGCGLSEIELCGSGPKAAEAARADCPGELNEEELAPSDSEDGSGSGD